MSKTAPSSRFGPYEIVAPLGAGGMGEVYRARDSRLARDVALKILPSALADPERQRRFAQEAQAAGALNHPNILAVYDVGAHDGVHYLVSELVDGSPLREEMERGPVPVKRLLALASQIADGLAAAHEAGIVHRDLKPENVMVTRDGRVKIVDFGLAKVLAPPAGTGASTVPATQTETGLVMGTVPYMSPEQARGGKVDFRSDQFSLGLVLYEMAAGVHAFRRDTGVQTLSAIIGEDARPVTEFCPAVPPLLWWLIERCLAKEAADRYASTRDLAHDLAAMRSRLSEVGSVNTVSEGVSRRRRVTVVAAIGVGLALTTAALAGSLWGKRGSLPTYQFTPLVTDEGFQGAPAWSPDGKTVAYVSQVDGILQVFTRNVASSLRGQVTDSRFDCDDPFWSPDGTRIFYHSLAREWESLWSVSVAGGPPDLVMENAAHADISPDGRTLAFFRTPPDQPGNKELWLSSPPGESPRRFTQTPFSKSIAADSALRFAPDGTKMLVWTYNLLDLDDQVGVPAPTFWIVPWPSGEPYQVLNALGDSTRAAVAFDWLPDGRHIIIALGEPRAQGTHLWVVDTESDSREPLTTTPASESRPAVTPDGRRVAFTSEAVDFDVIEIPVDGSPVRTMVTTSRNELDPAMAPDRTQYVYVSDRNGPVQIWLRSRQGQWERPLVTADQFGSEQTWTLGSPAFSPDGQRIAYQRLGERTGHRIWISTVAAAGPPVQLAPGLLYQDAPTWSPDGVWIAYLQRRAGGRFALVRARAGGGVPPDVIHEDVLVYTRPEWSPDGRWILCDTQDGLVIVSPDGKETRSISEEIWIEHTWGGDGSGVFGLREADSPGHYMLVEIKIATGTERVINADLGVIPPAFQPIRGFSRVENAAFLTSIARAKSDIWVLDGLEPPPGFFRRLWPFGDFAR